MVGQRLKQVLCKYGRVTCSKESHTPCLVHKVSVFKLASSYTGKDATEAAAREMAGA